MSRDQAVDFLLDFNGEKLEQENGYWIKIEARLVDVSSTVPHGLRYSLTLHDGSKRRILGYDNAHAVKLPRKSKRRGSTQAFDHKHRHISDHGVPYTFTTAQQLLDDFWSEVNRILRR
jgi:hypothetical protein